MRIIFLDIDGVINLASRKVDKYGQLFHKKWVDNLAYLIEYTGAVLVISSTWRHSGEEFLKEMWAYRNLPGTIIGVTPDLRIKGVNIPRGLEIEYYLEKTFNFHRINYSREIFLESLKTTEVENYVILDDDSDMLLSQREHFVRTSRNFNHSEHDDGYGLTHECMVEAVEILSTPIQNLYYPEL